jgi:hypothetical protein
MSAMKCHFVFPVLLAVTALSLHAAGPPGSGRLSRGYDPFNDPLYTSPPPPDYGAVWRDLKSSTDKLHPTLGAAHPEAAALLTQIQTNALFLETKWDDWLKTHSQRRQYGQRDPYYQGLLADARRVSKLKKEKDSEKAVSVLRDVALDLEIKADNCRASADGLGKEIKVRVHTKSGAKEVGGFEVYFVQKGMFDVKSAHDRFPRQSSPTDEKILPPGGYAMWARKKNFTSEPVSLRLGGHGETHLDVDLEVPAE